MQKKVVYLFLSSVVLASCSIFQKTEVVELEPIEVTMERPKEDKGTPQRATYNPSETRKHDLLHTKLDVRFDWKNSYLNGEATLTLKPYFYATNQLVLDAKGFDIHSVAMYSEESKTNVLAYEYDNKFLTINLDKEYTRKDTFHIQIKYTAKPNELEAGGSAAITSDKGLYFVNPDSSEADKPTQIWTQGETEASSCWFPTIDSPNERTTQELYITVDKKYKTLSNGLLVFSTENGDGTRTDYWKQSLSHTPYLFMMAVGDFAVVKDKWRDLEVHYYVEKEYEQYARDIFGNTPEMMEFFSNKLGVDYPWEKYHQVVVRDYVSGAMENTTAVIHGEFLQQTRREMLDGDNESIIAHELFHHWFGDLVTCESWSNLPLNESFANYSQFLWDEYKYGADVADHNAMSEMNGYLAESRQKQVDLIRFDYNDKEDMFDGHSYNKGGRILHMLRKYVGDDAFFEALRVYLENNKYKPAEVHHLRLAFEEVTGEDLNWFFDQWFLASGHPKMEYSYAYSDSTKQQLVTVKQTQDFDKTPLYKIPLDIDVYNGSKATRHRVWVLDADTTFAFDAAQKPDLVNVDAEKILLCNKSDDKPIEQFVHQYYNAPLYIDRLEAVKACGKKSDESSAKVMVDALDDKYWNIKTNAMRNMKKAIKSHKPAIREKLITLAKSDKKSNVRAQAIKTLVKHYDDDEALKAIYTNATKDSSYAVIAAGLSAIADMDATEGMKYAKQFEGEESSKIRTEVAGIYAAHGTAEQNEFFLTTSKKISGFSAFQFNQTYVKYLKNQDDATVNSALPVFEKTARTAPIWWMKLSGIQSLAELQSMYDKQVSKLKSEKTEKEGEGADAGSLAELDHKIKAAKDQSDKIDGILESIKEAETDPQVLRFLGK